MRSNAKCAWLGVTLLVAVACSDFGTSPATEPYYFDVSFVGGTSRTDVDAIADRYGLSVVAQRPTIGGRERYVLGSSLDAIPNRAVADLIARTLVRENPEYVIDAEIFEPKPGLE